MKQHKITKVSRVLFIFILVFGILTTQASAFSSSNRLRIFTFGDFQGALAENYKKPGGAKLAGQMRGLVAGSKDYGPLVLSAGNNFTRGEAGALSADTAPVSAMMKRMSVQYSAIGASEVTMGFENLTQVTRDSGVKFLSANIHDPDGAFPSSLTPYAVYRKETLMGGAEVTVGIIGLTSPALSTNGLTVSSPAEAAEKYLSILKNPDSYNCDFVIALTSLGVAKGTDGELVGEAAELAAAVPGLDAIVASGTGIDAYGKANGVPIVQSAADGRSIGNLDLSYQVEWDMSLKPLYAKPVLVNSYVSPVGSADPDSHTRLAIEEYNAKQ